ncbi:TonB-dependent receptor [Microbulbifer sp. 2205BS26-8]|uniref:TonB-dependent receptor n=1 Tax=Microbulbifer sp. 2205BS26-8 TaxID=3064386 RepID=UPI00273DEE08|nr:TonB-dependent receptor [Microbulbifer sp. 2205BS26-8]MDP5208506.1 TonB-dependent receptor [Microbulbifer sp. 2205BS26-8]
MKHTTIALALMALSNVTYGVSGQITDTAGQPISDASVSVAGSRVQTKTDADGRFTLNTADSNATNLHIKAPGFSHETVRLDATGSELLRVTLHRTMIEQIDVTATPLHASAMESAQPVSVLAGDNLRRKQSSTLGETLKDAVGVHSSYFGPVASSPIVRGLNGPRVLIAQNGLDVSDASRVGPDHVVATEAMTAEQIEILRGPATLFYGSGAIGGVINVVDDRVPSSSERRGAFAAAYNSVNEENETSFTYTDGTERFAFHVDGFSRNGDNYEIPGPAEQMADADQDEEPEEHSEGILENSASESQGFNLGGSWLLDNGYIGLSYGRLERLNGIPGHSHDHGHAGEHHDDARVADEHDEFEEASVLSDLKQDRWQLISELQLESAWLNGLNTRIGYTDYEHVELENGASGTVFTNETLQVRTDLLLEEIAGWRGAVSLEGKKTDFAAVGEEAFTPPSRTDSFAIGLLQEKQTGDLLWQLGARIEKVTINADPIAWEEEEHEASEEGGEHQEELLVFKELDFTPYSASAGVVWDFAAAYNAGVSVTHAQRAPSSAELFSFGPHIGTGSFEVGALFRLHESDDPHFHYNGDVNEEVSNNIDLSLRKHAGDIGWAINLFYNQIDNSYYERNIGLDSEAITGHDHEEGEEAGHEGEHEHDHGALPVYVFEQADTVLYGLEAQFAWRLSEHFTLDLWGDSIRAKLRDGGNLPRTPPVRIGGRLNYANKAWQAGFGMAHYFDQKDTAELETSTDGYSLLEAELGYALPSSFGDMTFFLKGSNLTDEEARVHTSFLKDRAPLPGRNFSLGVRSMF